MTEVACCADTRCLTAAAVLSLVLGMSATSAEHHLVILNMQVTLDQVSQERSATAHTRLGQIDQLRVVYDPAAVDPATHRVHLLNFQHLMDGHYSPPDPDPVSMPMTDAWLDLGTLPYRMHLRAAVMHGSAILIEVDEVSRRLTIHPQSDPRAVIISGPYTIDPTPLPGALITSSGPR